MVEVVLIFNFVGHRLRQIVKVLKFVMHKVVVVLKSLLKLFRHLQKHVAHAFEVVLSRPEEVQTVPNEELDPLELF